MANVRNSLTQAQQDVFHNGLRDIGIAIERAAYALHRAGVATFDAIDTMDEEVSDMCERGVRQTLEILDEV